MRNVNLNILKFLESINNFCLSLVNIGLGDSILRVGSQESGVGSREIGDRSQETFLFILPTSPLPHYPTSHCPRRLFSGE
nr:hypothetical protein [Microcystis aeruginosa]